MSSRGKEKALASRLERLTVMITELQEEAGLGELRAMLAEGVDPKALLAACMEAMHRIGMRFESGSYFIAALIMAGEIMSSATELLSPHLTDQQSGGSGGRIMLGTIQGDIHDLGKNLFALLLKCHGIEVIDLGVDVPARVFLEQAEKQKPDMIGISCVLTTSLEYLKQAIRLLTDELPASGPPIVIGGTCINQQMAAHVEAPLWAEDATGGLRICREILQFMDRD
ncbi:MAG: cobalamin-dependent protein [Desulfobacteraceae bacterium]|jgi:methanogenic corrinoid protein MtbC1